MADEIELKLFFPPEALDQVLADPRFNAGLSNTRSKILDNTYFDTPDLLLNQNKVAVRVRKIGPTVLQTVKCAGESVAGLSSRPEWEKPFSGEFDFEDVSDLSLKAFLEAEKQRLIPLFSTCFERRTVPIQFKPGVEILVMIDQGKVSTSHGDCPISELELELASGNALDLIEFAIELASRLPLVPFDQSKAERGYRLFLQAPAKPAKAGKSAISGMLTTTQSFGCLANQGIRAWEANLYGSLTQFDPEYLHQMRVALRRLTTLLKLFEPILDPSFFCSWNGTLKALTANSGAARDLDVMKEVILLPMLAEMPAHKHTPVLRALAHCTTARDAATGTPETQSSLAMLRFTKDIQLLNHQATADSIEAFAEARLNRLYKSAVKRLRRVRRETTPRNAHRLRIAFKHLRYACELMQPLFNEAEMADYAKVLASLQDDLGYLNDLHVALAYLEKWIVQEPKLAKARDLVASWHAPHAEGVLRKVLDEAASVLEQCQPWCTECAPRPRLRASKCTQGKLVLKIA